MTDHRPVLVIDGSAFSTFEGFAREFSRHLEDYEWRGNLDAFNDILHGGFGTPEGGFLLRWTHSEQLRAALGYAETVKLLENRLETCHPLSRSRIVEDLDRARRGVGPTLFDDLVEIIRSHEDDESGVGGIVLQLA